MLTPLLQRLGSVLDEAGAAWSVVHEESGPQIDDVTLHVAPADTDLAVDALDRCGFAPLGSGTDHLAPDGRAGCGSASTPADRPGAPAPPRAA